MVFYSLKCKDRTNLKSNSQKVIQYQTGRKRLSEVCNICAKNKSCFLSSEAYQTLQKAGIPTVDGGILAALQRKKKRNKRRKIESQLASQALLIYQIWCLFNCSKIFVIFRFNYI